MHYRIYPAVNVFVFHHPWLGRSARPAGDRRWKLASAGTQQRSDRAGLAVALVIVRVARPALVALVRIVERVTDPLVAKAVWRRRPTLQAS